MSVRPILKTVRLAVILPAVAAALGAALAFGGCGDRGGRVELVLHCAAGLRQAMAPMIVAFEARQPVAVHVTYEGSGQLLGKIAAGAGGDLFVPGAAFYLDKAADQGLIDPATRKIVAYYVPVLFAAKGNPLGIRTLRDLTRPGVRVGLGDERSAAVGETSLELFKKNDIPYDQVRPNVVYKSGTVNELGVAIQMHTVDVVILWDVNARQFAAYGDTVAIPPAENAVSTVPIAVLKTSAHPAEAMAFIEFVTSEEGKRILAANGVTVTLKEGKEPHE
jgi:molybdate transport system substrate-binding protein